MKCPDYDLKTARDEIFDRLCVIWDESLEAGKNDIWRKANTLQSIARYFRSYSGLDSEKVRCAKALAIMENGYAFYQGVKNNKWWVDDYGWWGGLFLDLYDYKLGGVFEQASLKAELKFAYEQMRQNLDTTYGGIWNVVEQDGSEKNTVTNAWALRLAAGLAYMNNNDPSYIKLADEHYKWLTTGEYNGKTPDTWGLWNSDGLIYWTPLNPLNVGPNHSYSPTALWSGNEGVLLEALNTYSARFDDNRRKEILEPCKRLVQAAVSPLTANGFVDSESVCHESPAAADWSNDLATGKGVMLRLMFQFAKGHDLLTPDFRNLINATAQSVWCSQEMKGKANSQVVRNWNPGFGPSQENDRQSGGLWPLVLQAGGLDALNTAYSLSKL
jgi:hypothetical protein